MNKLLKISVVALALLTAGRVRAQFNILSDSTSMNATGWAQVSPQPVTNYSSSGMGGNVSGTVLESAPSAAASANSSANLTAIFTPGQINFTSDLYVNTGGGSASTGQYCYAEADYSFSLNFSVLNPVSYNLSFPSLQGSGHQHTLNEQFNFSSANTGLLVSQPTYGPGYSGILTPGDTYTITVSEQVTANTPDFYGNEWRQELDFNLTAVPEPSSTLLLGTGAALAGLFALQRKW